MSSFPEDRSLPQESLCRLILHLRRIPTSLLREERRRRVERRRSLTNPLRVSMKRSLSVVEGAMAMAMA
jgi:hypothetical protein